MANRWKFLMQLMTDKLTHHISSCCCHPAWAGKPCSLADVLRLALAHDSMVINSHYSAWRLLYVVLLVWLVAVQIFLSVHIFICATPTLFPRESGLNSPLGKPSKIAKLRFTNLQTLIESETYMLMELWLRCTLGPDNLFRAETIVLIPWSVIPLGAVFHIKIWICYIHCTDELVIG